MPFTVLQCVNKDIIIVSVKICFLCYITEGVNFSFL